LIEKSAAGRVFSHEHIISSALGWAYSKEGISGLICYQNSGNCRFVENGLDYRSIRPDFADMNKIYPYEDILVFQKMEDGSADLLYDIKSLNSSTSEYNPYDRIASYLPFPKLPQKAFYASVGPNPLHLSPKDWDGVNLTLNDRKVCDVSEDQQCSLHLQGDASGLASFHQEIKVGGKAGQIAMLSLLIKAERISDDTSWPQTALTFINTDGTTTQYSQTLEKLTGDWCNFIWEVQAAKPFQAILVSVESGSGSWSVWVDTLQLDIDNTPVNILNPSFED
jgi:hypothetical protein